MRSPRLGDPVYWVSHDRPPGKSAAVDVHSGTVVSREGNRYAARPDGDSAAVVCLTERDAAFADAADADTFAFGVACRLLANFKYESVTVATTKGSAVVTASDAFRPLVST